MIRVGIVGLGKMGMSHFSMINAHPGVTVPAICDSSGFLLSVIQKYTGVNTYSDMAEMIAAENLDAVIISTPNSLHARMVRSALESGLHVFCEKPFCMDPADSDGLAELADSKSLVTQVGYHNRYVGAFQEVKRLLDDNAIGRVTHVLAEAYGPVVLKPKGGTWRSRSTEGGGCLYDYAAHPINLLNWYLGSPDSAGGTVLNGVFSKDTDDEVFGTLYWANKVTAQVSVNWSDESQRKMTTKISVWGTEGRITSDRQECQVYLRENASIPPGYVAGWNVKNTTDLTSPVDFYLRGEEYSAQLDAFVQRIATTELHGVNDFRSAAATDRVLAMMVRDSKVAERTTPDDESALAQTGRRRQWYRRLRRERALQTSNTRTIK